MTTKLELYNDALHLIGERKLASLSEERKPRRMLDDHYADTVKACLEEADWLFATRTSKLEYESGYTAPFGYRRQFEKPSDLVRLSKLCQDEYMDIPLLKYDDNTGFWFCDLDEIYVSYVSNDASYGLDLSLWPESFKGYVAHELALAIAPGILQSDTKEEKLEKKCKKAKMEAKNKNAINNPTRFPPPGGWTSARHGQRMVTRKNRSSLLG